MPESSVERGRRAGPDAGDGRESLVQSLRAIPAPGWVLFAGTLVNKFGNYLQVFLVLYLTSRGYSAGVAGVALGLAGLGNFAGNAVGGAATDRFGRRRVIAVSMFGSAAFTALVPFVDGLPAILLLVGLAGFFAQLYRPAAAALLLDVVPEPQRVTAFAAYRMAINVGMALGPVLGGYLSGRSYALIFLLDALSSVVYGLLAILALPDTGRPAAAARPAPGATLTPLLDRRFAVFLAAMFASSLVYVQTMAMLPVHVVSAGLPNSAYGILLGVNALVVIAIELPVTHRLQRVPAHLVIAAGLVVLGLGLGATNFAATLPALLGTVLIWTLGEIVASPIATTVPGRRAPGDLRGAYQGAFAAALTLAYCVGPALGGLLFSRGQALLWGACAAVDAGSAVLVLLAGRVEERER